jgi:hypothetical protein
MDADGWRIIAPGEDTVDGVLELVELAMCG